MQLPDTIRQVTLFPESDQPDLPPGHPSRRIEVEGVFVILPGGAPNGLVFPESVDGVEDVVASVRQFLRDEQLERAIWFVPEAASPHDLAQRLLALGMRPNDMPGGEARDALMVCLDTPPPPGPPGLVARPAATFDEYLAAHLVTVESFGIDERTREAVAQRAERLWPFQFAPGGLQMFVAVADGEIVASGSARFGRSSTYLWGGCTHPDHRGRGAYSALVRARWEAAVERRTPVLTVAAGAMSRPILERLGFSIVGWEDCLLDEL